MNPMTFEKRFAQILIFGWFDGGFARLFKS